MFKIVRITVLLTLMTAAFQAGKLWEEKCFLRENIIRLHVIADSDSSEDQALKLQVKDAIVSYLTPYMEQFDTREEALTFLGENLEQIRLIGMDVLEQAGVDDSVMVSVGEETFDTRHYDTFSLPSGIYQSLRVEIGSGEGKNWWCVAFPTLCVPASGESFEEVAVSAGLSEELSQTLKNNGEYELRFYFLDKIGALENLFFGK